ncbi:PTS sugar transporter subunit IIA [Cohnella boryungensis]|uniref:Mannitol-specific phosphotransferase enzyme IIA component n=1 Tax=Cohnella boryungensis TaxID=768479 RepID=A0ABV8SCL1_9BACL
MGVLSPAQVKLNVRAQDKYEVIRLVGQLLVQAGHVPVEYIDRMIEREDSLSTYMGGGLAIPHGTNESKALIRSTGMAVAVLPEGVDFGDGQLAKLVIGIAAIGDDHMDLLTSVAVLCADDDNLERILHAPSEATLIEIFETGVAP